MYAPVTPVSSRRSGALSPPPSTTGSTHTYTPGQPQRLNVVTRLAIEGKAKQNKDGVVPLKMYMKLNIPTDSVSPGSTIALFPEENLKILSSQVHPLDANSTPYNFSSTAFPLLNDAGRALSLPARSSKSYLSVFGLSQSPVVSSSRSSPTSVNGSSSTLPLDDRYTGHILVSGYHVSYVLPRDFPPRNRDDDTPIRTPSSARSRRPSIGERNSIQFMAALEVLVPYLSQPPRAPYLLSVPIPRCLSNHIRLRIFPPGPAPAQSFASLSSAEDDQQRWDVVCEPHITQTAGKLSRTRSYGEMADDESSDSTSNYQSAGLQDGIQGTFPSSDYIRIRWALPVKSLDFAGGGGRRRVGVAQAKGELTCVVLGKGRDKESDKEGIVMRVEQKGTCKGVWFAGVATMLGMDIGLVAKNAEAVLWAPGEEAKWTVSGGRGYTGYDLGTPSEETRESSLEYPDMMSSTASPPFLASLTTRQDSTSSNTSLMRVPLPVDPIPEYSFEGRTNNLTPATTLSSISSAPLSDMRSRASSMSVEPNLTVKSPTNPLTVHININDLIPTSKKDFTFTISGTILVIPRTRSLNASNGRAVHADTELDTTPVVLPQFSVLAADHESVTTFVRNDCNNAKLEVYNISGDLRDAQTLKTVLQTGKSRDCGKEGGRIALRTLPPSPSGTRGYVNGIASPSPRPRTTSTPGKSGIVPTYMASARRKREGPAIIPSVKATITPLTLDFSGSLKAYAVRLSLTAPSDLDSPWLEFGLAQPNAGTSASPIEHGDPDVSIAGISMDGISARYESSTRNKEDILAELDTLNRAGDSEWVAWVKVHVGEAGGQLQVDYVVTHDTSAPTSPAREGKGKAKPSDVRLGVLLPTFTMPVGCLDATIESHPALSAYTVRSNLSYQYDSPHGRRLLHYSIEDLFSPWLLIETQPPPSRTRVVAQSAAHSLQTVVRLLPALLLLLLVLNVGTEFRHMRRSLDAWGSALSTQPESAPGPVPMEGVGSGTGAGVTTETVFVTATLTSTVTATSTKRPGWFADTASSSASTASSSSDTISSTARGKVTKDAPTPSSQISTPKNKNRPTKSLRPEAAPSSSPSRPAHETETDSLAPLMDFPWLLNIQLHPAAKKAIETMIDGLGIVWHVFRRVYHYPLDPP